MHLDRVIVCTYIWSDGLSNIPDDTDTLTCQTSNMNDVPRNPFSRSHYMESFPHPGSTAMSTVLRNVTITAITLPLRQDITHCCISYLMQALSLTWTVLWWLPVPTQFDSPVMTWFDLPVPTRFDSPVVIWLDSPVPTWFYSLVSTWFNSPVPNWFDSPFMTWFDSPVTIWFNSPVLTWFDSSFPTCCFWLDLTHGFRLDLTHIFRFYFTHI